MSLTRTAVVTDKHQIIIDLPELESGIRVEVVIDPIQTLKSQSDNTHPFARLRRIGNSHFQSIKEVDDHIREGRESWEG